MACLLIIVIEFKISVSLYVSSELVEARTKALLLYNNQSPDFSNVL